MKKQFLIYCAALAVLAIIIKWVEYRYLVIDNAVEVYGTVLAIIFTVVGIWAGNKLTTPKKEIIREEVIVEKPVYITAGAGHDNPKADPEKWGISKREMEILQLMAQGLSNQEIAETTFLSIHTIKTHASNLFMKLDVKRRTQAISRAKELDLIS